MLLRTESEAPRQSGEQAEKEKIDFQNCHDSDTSLSLKQQK